MSDQISFADILPLRAIQIICDTLLGNHDCVTKWHMEEESGQPKCHVIFSGYFKKHCITKCDMMEERDSKISQKSVTYFLNGPLKGSSVNDVTWAMITILYINTFPFDRQYRKFSIEARACCHSSFHAPKTASNPSSLLVKN